MNMAEQQNEEQSIEYFNPIPPNQQPPEGNPQKIEILPEEIEKVITNTRSSSRIYMFFGLVDFGLVLAALIILPSECDVTNLKDYFTVAFSLTCFKLLYLCYQIHIFSKELSHIKAEGKNHKLPHDPKSFARSETYVASMKKKNTCFGLISYLYITFELGYFIYANIVLYSDMSSVCKIGAPQYDFTWGVALYFLIERYIGLGLPILLFICSLCCLPCLAMFGMAAIEIDKQQQQALENEQQQKKQEQELDERQRIQPEQKHHKQENQVEIEIQDYDIVKDRVTDENMCSICVQEFKIGQAVQRLKCDKDHVFHNDCLQNWMKTNSVCPICKSPIKQNKNDKIQVPI